MLKSEQVSSLVNVLSHSVVSSSLSPRGLQPTRLHCAWGLSRLEWAAMPSSRSLVNSRIQSQLSDFDTFAIVVQSLGCAQLCDPRDCSTPGFPVLLYLSEFAQTRVH